MKISRLCIMFLIVVFFSLSAVYAEDIINIPQSACKFTKNYNFTVSGNGPVETIEGYDAILDKRREDLLALSKSMGITDLVVQSYNYTLQKNNNQYTVSWSINFTSTSCNDATAYMKEVEKMGLSIYVNVNAYRSCS